MGHFRRRVPAPTVRGGYEAFRPCVREDFRETCAYCLLHELWAAGEESFQLDHFRPRKYFKELLNDFYNIYYSCYRCNKNKHDKWPTAAQQVEGIGFVDFCQDELGQHYEELEDGTWHPLTPSAVYTIKMLRLNSEHLVKVRLLIRKIVHEDEDQDQDEGE